MVFAFIQRLVRDRSGNGAFWVAPALMAGATVLTLA